MNHINLDNFKEATMFKQLVGETAVIRTRGMYKTCNLYSYNSQLFAKVGSGFIRLNADGSSSVDGTNLDLLAYSGPLFKDKFGRLCVEPGKDFTQLEAKPDGTILPLLEAPK
jgi:hypothetical protein